MSDPRNPEKRPPREEDPYTPDAKVSLSRVVGEMGVVNEHITLYLNRSTGETFFVSDEIDVDAEDFDDDELSSLPDWERETIEKSKEVLESDDWIELPSQFDLDEYRAMTEFAQGQHPGVSRTLGDALHGSGAFRRFKRAIDEFGVREEWFEFREGWIADAVRRVLERHRIPFRR
ncbi:MAG: hypothetical protein KY459_11865 [Acidobacteria bacterium]|nr:hypothetical protein [Acidobacteriota bacterium]